MDCLQSFLSQARFRAQHLFSDVICGLSPTHYTGSVGYIHFFRGGKLTVMPEGQAPFTLTEPALVIFPGAGPHRLHGDEKQGARMLCSVVDCAPAMRNAVRAVMPDMIVIPVAQSPVLQGTLNALLAEADARKMGWQLACERNFEYQLLQVFRWAIETKLADEMALAGFGDAKLARSLEALNGDLSKDWSLDNLAKFAGMSRSSFVRRFSEVIGVTPAEYVLDMRVTAAKGLLKRGMAVKATAAETGFSSAAVFSRAFSRKTGHAPVEWLKHGEAASSA